MKLQDCIAFAREHPVCFFATTDGNQPHVRALLSWFADETGFYFETFRTKDVFRQLQANPRVEVCFFNHSQPGEAKTLRVRGTVEFLHDAVLRDRLFREWPWLREWASGPEDSRVQIFRIARGEAIVWAMSDGFSEEPHERFPL